MGKMISGPESYCPMLKKKVPTVIKSALLRKSMVLPSCPHFYDSKWCKKGGAVPFCVYPETTAEADRRINQLGVGERLVEWKKFPKCPLSLKR